MYHITECQVAEEQTFGKRTLETRLAIMLYELGAIARNLVFAGSTADERMWRAYYVDLVTELSDLVTQAHLLLQSLPTDVNWYELQQDGMERQIERMQEWWESREKSSV